MAIRPDGMSWTSCAKTGRLRHIVLVVVCFFMAPHCLACASSQQPFLLSPPISQSASPELAHPYGMVVFSNCKSLTTLYVAESWKTLLDDDYYFWYEWQEVPSGCEIVYYAPQTTTASGVPYSWLEGYGLGDGTVEGYEVAAAAEAANGRKVWECYVMGVSPTNAEDDFKVAIAFSNGVPQVSWEPDLNDGKTQPERSYVVEGKPTMTDEWDATNAASRFFRVKVGRSGGSSGASGE